MQAEFDNEWRKTLFRIFNAPVGYRENGVYIQPKITSSGLRDVSVEDCMFVCHMYEYLLAYFSVLNVTPNRRACLFQIVGRSIWKMVIHIYTTFICQAQRDFCERSWQNARLQSDWEWENWCCSPYISWLLYQLHSGAEAIPKSFMIDRPIPRTREWST